ncbi:patched domain-containing protein 3 [Osmerus mordax]|uniref:patched domain-containing protein 3 n=1 Tax=Osmerus mordax TaxID=8014 RepID=UPI00350F4BC7
MAKCRTNCIEKPVCICFEIIGLFIGSHPWWFVTAPLIISAALGSGFYFLEDCKSSNIEKQFTPMDGPAKAERRYVQETFPQREGMFSSLRLSTDGDYAVWIASNHTNVWTEEIMREVLDLDSRVRNMAVPCEEAGEHFKYLDVCATVDGNCTSNGILEILSNNPSNVNRINLTFPTFFSEAGQFNLHQSLGSVKLDNNLVRSAMAIQLYYYLREDNTTKNNLWLEKFIALLSSESATSIQVSHSTSMSMQWEFDKTPKSIIKLFAITYTIAIVYAIISCVRLDQVRSKVWVAVAGVLSSGLGVLSGFGLVLLLGQTFVMTVASAPFLVLGIGLDDMFILLSAWQKTSVLTSVSERLADTYREAAVSITITTVTDALALFLGYSSSFGSVQSFCLYAGSAILFCFLYNVSFLGGVLALNGRREAGNRHWFTCSQIPRDLPPGKPIGYGVCCVGGAYNLDTGAEVGQPMDQFFRKFYGPFLTQGWVKLCVGVLYAGYLAASVFGCCLMKEGIDLRHLASYDSYIIRYYNDQKAHFSSNGSYGPVVMAAVKGPYPYWSAAGRANLSSCMEAFQGLGYVDGAISWLQEFRVYANETGQDISTEAAFQGNLSAFLQRHPAFSQDVNITEDERINGSRFFLLTLEGQVSEAELLTGMRSTAKRCRAELGVDLMVYHPSFIYHDQYTVIRDNTVQTLGVSTVAMLVVSLILIPNLLCSLWVAFSIGSVIVGVAGFMSLWDVSLDSISMINLVICIGFAVDFSAHVAYAFVSSSKNDANEKATEALANLGYPIMQGALSTILGVVVLSASGSYIFWTFFRIMVLVILFGLLHGLVFIPVFLTVFGTCRN